MKKQIKNFKESKWYVIVVVPTVSAVAAIMLYFTSQKLEIKSLDFKSQLNFKQGQINELKTQLSSKESQIQLLERLLNHEEDIKEVELSDFEKEIDSLRMEVSFLSERNIILSSIEEQFGDLYDVLWRIEYLEKEKLKIQKEVDTLIERIRSDEITTDYFITEKHEKIKNPKIDINEYDKFIEIVRTLFVNNNFNHYFSIGYNEPISSDSTIELVIQTFINILPHIKKFLILNPEHKIYIDGHADRIPYLRDSYSNIDLSKERAINSMKLLVEAGLEQKFFVIDWYGEFHNILNTNHDKIIGQPRNRRVEFRIINNLYDSIPAVSKDYLKFRNSFQIKIGNIIKQFKHEKGFWIEDNYNTTQYEIIRIVYLSYLYKALMKHQVFKEIMRIHKSPIYEDSRGCQGQSYSPLSGQLYSPPATVV